MRNPGKKRVIRTRQKRTLIKHPSPAALCRRRHMWASASNSLVSSLNRLLLFASSTQSRDSHLLRWRGGHRVPRVPRMHTARSVVPPHRDSEFIHPLSRSASPALRVRRVPREPPPRCPWAKGGWGGMTPETSGRFSAGPHRTVTAPVYQPLNN